jgi:LysM repeat protein
MNGVGGGGSLPPMAPPAKGGGPDAAVAGAAGGGLTATDAAGQAGLGALLQQLTAAITSLAQAITGAGAIGGGPGTPPPATDAGTTPPPAAPPTTPAETPPTTTPAAPGKEPKTYTVKQGDTLSKIAREHGIKKWQELYELNKDVIGPDPNKIKPGQVLKLPDGATEGTGGEAPPKRTTRREPRREPRRTEPNPDTDNPNTGGLTAAQRTALQNERSTLQGERDRLNNLLMVNGGRIGTQSAVSRLQAIDARIAAINSQLG